MIQDAYNIISDFLDSHQLGLIWLIIIAGCAVTLIDRKRKGRNKHYIYIDGSKTKNLPLKPLVNWPLNILTVFLGGSMSIVLIIHLIKAEVSPDDWEILLGIFTLMVCWALYSLRWLSVKFTVNEIVFNYNHHKLSGINHIEIWDDLIFIKFKNETEKKIWLRFRAKEYQKAVTMISAIENFCTKKDVPLENHFSSDIESNEVFNPSS